MKKRRNLETETVKETRRADGKRGGLPCPGRTISEEGGRPSSEAPVSPVVSLSHYSFCSCPYTPARVVVSTTFPGSQRDHRFELSARASERESCGDEAVIGNTKSKTHVAFLARTNAIRTQHACGPTSYADVRTSSHARRSEVPVLGESGVITVRLCRLSALRSPRRGRRYCVPPHSHP